MPASQEPLLNLAAWVPCTEVEGPGRRFALWTQGCLLRCPGCCNPHMFALAPRWIVPVSQLVKEIAQAREQFHIQGITLLGGEPVLQARSLAVLARECRRAELSVMLFTGYYLEQLQEARFPGVEELLAVCDVVVAGPYRRELPETRRNWAGSANQRFHYLTDRYGPEIETDPRFRPAIEIRFHPNGLAMWNGWPVVAATKKPPSRPLLEEDASCQPEAAPQESACPPPCSPQLRASAHC